MCSVYYGNIHSEQTFVKGSKIMKNIKRNGVVSMFLAFALIFITYILVTDEQIAQYEQIEIGHGDSLWSLAEQYRGKMAKHDWIQVVKKHNQLSSEQITVGQQLVVPVEKSSVHIVKANNAEQQLVKVASDN